MTEIVLVRLPLAAGDEALFALMASLPAEERQTVERLRRPDDRLRAATVRRLARRHASLRLGVAESSLRFGRTVQGRPFVHAPSGVEADFNLSHHGAWAVLAWCATGRVGVDLACPADVTAPLAPAFVAAREMTLVQTEAAEDVSLARLWALKEAYLKLDGRGLLLDPRTLAFDPVAWRRRRYRLAAPSLPIRFSVRTLRDGMLLAVAREDSAGPLRLTRLSWRALVLPDKAAVPARRPARQPSDGADAWGPPRSR